MAVRARKIFLFKNTYIIMPGLRLKLKKPLQRIEIIKASEYENYVEDAELDESMLESLADDFLIDEDLAKPITKIVYTKPVFTEEFTISNANQPIQISLEKIPEDAIPIDEVRQQVQSAYDKGFVDGQNIVRSTLEVEIQKQQDWIRNIDSVIKDFRNQYYKEIKDFEESIIELSIMLSEKILEHEISHNSKIVIEQAAKAIRSLGANTVFKIRVHPMNVETLTTSKSELFTDNELINSVKIIADDTIDPMGCILETSAGLVDARLSTQLGLLRKALDEQSQKSIEEISEDIESYGNA